MDDVDKFKMLDTRIKLFIYQFTINFMVRVLAKISTTTDFDDILPQNQSESETNEFLVHFHIHLIVFTLWAI